MNIQSLFPQFYVDAEYDTYRCRHELYDLGFKWDADKKLWWHKSEAERDAAESWLPLKEDEYYEFCEPTPPWD